MLRTLVLTVGRERPQAPCMRATERSEALSESQGLAPDACSAPIKGPLVQRGLSAKLTGGLLPILKLGWKYVQW